MADDEEEDSGPVVELGDGPAVDGAPLARISSRLHFGIPKSEVLRRVGSEEIRTPDGPRTMESVLGESDETYFPASEDLRATVEDVVGTGPVPTREREDRDADSDEETAAPDGAADAEAVTTDGENTDAAVDDSDEE